MFELVERLKAQQRDLEAVLCDTKDDDAHHLQRALNAIKIAIVNVEERLRDTGDEASHQ